MKVKRIVLALVAMVTVSTAAVAQPDQPRRERPNKTEMIKKRTDNMVQKYGLNEAQATKLLELNTKYADKMRPGGRHFGPRPPRDGQATEEGQRRPAEMEAYDKELQEILTSDQYQQYKTDREKMRQERPHVRHRGPRGGHPEGQE